MAQIPTPVLNANLHVSPQLLYSPTPPSISLRYFKLSSTTIPSYQKKYRSLAQFDLFPHNTQETKDSADANSHLVKNLPIQPPNLCLLPSPVLTPNPTSLHPPPPSKTQTAIRPALQPQLPPLSYLIPHSASHPPLLHLSLPHSLPRALALLSC